MLALPLLEIALLANCMDCRPVSVGAGVIQLIGVIRAEAAKAPAEAGEQLPCPRASFVGKAVSHGKSHFCAGPATGDLDPL